MNKKSAFYTEKISNLVSRRNYSKVNHDSFEPPSLMGLQSRAYKNFIENDLEKIIQSFFPIYSNSGNLELHFDKITLKKPEISEFTAWEQSKTYQSSLYVQLKLINNETGEIKSASKSGRGHDNAIFFGDIPLITEKGTFIVNGIEKFVISQIVRAPGPYILTKSQIKLSNARKRVQEGVVCEILPIKGTLLLLCIPEGRNHIKILARNNSGDNAAQFSATTLLKGFGLTQRQILEIFEGSLEITNSLQNEVFNKFEILGKEEIVEILSEIANTKDVNAILEEHDNRVDFHLYELLIKFHTKFGKQVQDLDNELKNMSEADNNYLPLKNDLEKVLNQAADLLERIATESAARYIINELNISYKYSKTPCSSYQALLWNYFCEKRLYDMGKVGRYKLNRKLRLSERLYQQILAQDIKDNTGKVLFKKGTLMMREEIDKFKKLSKAGELDILHKVKLNFTPKAFKSREIGKEVTYEKILIYRSQESQTETLALIGNPNFLSWESLTIMDLISVCSYISHMEKNIGKYDDIDHLGNKRLRLISELSKNRIQVAMLRIEKFIKEKMNNLEAKLKHVSIKNETNKERLTVKSLINTKPFQIIMKEFFNSHQLTQFIDQQNPLSELTNKRRISAMGPGGINREDPNLDIRDVHYSHYGRICPIETPEGMNIGLIMSLASYAQIDEHDFITTPYFRVRDGVVTDEVVWLSALREDEYVIAEAMVPRDQKNKLKSPVAARYRSLIENFDAKDVNFIDISPRQVVSVATSLIPFLENDDANRALMGANMQRQATPLLKPYAPIVGTGYEYKIAHDSGMVLTAKENGVVVGVDGDAVTIRHDGAGVNKKYPLIKFKRSNQDTCNNQTPIVRIGERVQKNQTLVDGPAMQNGELSLGQNVLVAFTTWSGYNFEDAIILSSRLVEEDIYTSVHIDEHTIECLRTKNGDEEITRQIPNVSDDAKRYLDEDGIIMIGAEVHEGDILVGKTSPKGHVEQSSEEKLLQAIFSEKVKQVKDSSLKVPHGGEGVVASVKRFSVHKGNSLNDDVIEVIKVFIAQKRKIQVGDKMAGRHGNKGIVSKIVPIADMPYLKDGTPIDVMLNPLGVPSRMNIGQVLEMHLGLAARRLAFKKLIALHYDEAPIDEVQLVFGLDLEKAQALMKNFQEHVDALKIKTHAEALKKLKEIDLSVVLKAAGLLREDLGFKIATPVFSGVNQEDLVNIMRESGIDPLVTKSKFDLYDGRTGEKFDKPISVGVMYMLKLDHMVDDKIHARSVGSYSKITQQPLGGKSQNGGQRFGEMEVWALEAYGAAYNLRELLTIKSDDVQARNLVYSAIIKGKKLPQPGLPESFKLLIKKIEGLCFRINVKYGGSDAELINSHHFINQKLENTLGVNSIDRNYETELSSEINELLSSEQELEDQNPTETENNEDDVFEELDLDEAEALDSADEHNLFSDEELE